MALKAGRVGVLSSEVDTNGKIKGGGSTPYVLPVATASTLGGVKIGSGVKASKDGTISVDSGSGGGDWTLLGTVDSSPVLPDTFSELLFVANSIKSSYTFSLHIEKPHTDIIKNITTGNANYCFGTLYSSGGTISPSYNGETKKIIAGSKTIFSDSDKVWSKTSVYYR